jgi:hypothetical protein
MSAPDSFFRNGDHATRAQGPQRMAPGAYDQWPYPGRWNRENVVKQPHWSAASVGFLGKEQE